MAASPASKSPGLSFARGSLVSDPVIPGGSGCGASGANGSACTSFCDAAGEGDGELVCANVLTAKQAHKRTQAATNLKVITCTRFIVSPLEGSPRALIA